MKRELRVPAEGLARGVVELPEETARYIVKVHRLKEGDALVLFDPLQGLEARATVVSDRLPRVQVDIAEEPVEAPTHNLPITIIQALGKGDKPEQAVRDATVFGAERLVFLRAERSVAKSAGDAKRDRLLRVAAQVARQCERGDLPELVGPIDFEDAFALSGLELTRKLICGWGEEALPLLGALSREELRSSGATIMIGPEGGFTPTEIETAQNAGYQLVSLGPYVLRTEVACGAVLAALRARDLSD